MTKTNGQEKEQRLGLPSIKIIYVLLLFIVVITIVGCCIWEKNDMRPKGCVMHLISISVVAGTPIGCWGEESNNCDFIPVIPAIPLPFTWAPPDTHIYIQCTVRWPCVWRRSNLYYGIGGISPPSPDDWSVYDDTIGADWFLTPDPPNYKDYVMGVELVSLIALLPGGTGNIWLLTVCGPEKPQCLWSSVSNPMPM